MNRLKKKKKNEKQWYATYKRFTLALRTHTGWEWGDGKGYSTQMITKRKQE